MVYIIIFKTRQPRSNSEKQKRLLSFSFVETIYILDSTEKLTNDYEIQNWAHSLVDEEQLGLKVCQISKIRRQVDTI